MLIPKKSEKMAVWGSVVPVLRQKRERVPKKWGTVPFTPQRWDWVGFCPGWWCKDGVLGQCCAGLCRIVPVLR